MHRFNRTSFVAILLAVVMLMASITAQAAPPVATNFSATVSTVGSTLIQLQGSDPDGTALTFAIASSPSHGTISSLNTANGYLVFTPSASYVGTDSFTFTVTSGGDTTAPATCSLTITNAKTRIVDALVDVAGQPRAGKVTFILTQKKVQSPAGLMTETSTVSAQLNGSGQFDLSVYPSSALSPQSFYQVWFEPTGSLRRESVGIYNIPATTAASITLAPHRVIDTNLTAQYTFIDAVAMNTLLSAISGVGAIYNGTPVDNALQKYDSASGKIENSAISDNGTTVTISNKVQMPGTKSLGWEATGINAPSASDIEQGTKLLFYPGAAPDHLSMGVESGALWTNVGAANSVKWYFGAVHKHSMTANSFTINGTVNATNFVGNGSGLTGITGAVASVFGRTGTVTAQSGDYSFSQISGSVTDAQVPDGITLTNFNQITTRSASDLNAGIAPTARLGTGTANSNSVLLGNNTWSDFPVLTHLGFVTSGHVSAPSTSNSLTGTKIMYFDAASGEHFADGLESGFIWRNVAAAGGDRIYFGASAAERQTRTRAEYLIESGSNTFTFDFQSSNLTPSALRFDTNAAQMQWLLGSIEVVELGSTSFHPFNDNFFDLGASGKRWKDFYVNRIHAGQLTSYKTKVTTKTANYTITAAESGTTFVNTGASGSVTLTLPPYAEGLTYTFVVAEAFTFNISADGSDLIVAGGSDNSAVQGSVVGTSSTLTAVGGKWFITAADGTNLGFQP